MAKDLSKIAKQKKIKYFLISFVDLFGVLRSKLVPTEAIKGMQKNGKKELTLIELENILLLVHPVVKIPLWEDTE